MLQDVDPLESRGLLLFVAAPFLAFSRSTCFFRPGACWATAIWLRGILEELPRDISLPFGFVFELYPSYSLTPPESGRFLLREFALTF